MSDMVCPYCNKNMVLGQLGCKQGSGLFFTKKGVSFPSNLDARAEIESQGIVVLDGPNHFFRVRKSSVMAYQCEACKKIMIAY